MGKIVIASDKIDYKRLVECFNKNHISNFEKKEDDFQINVYRKIRMNSENFYTEGDDYIIGAGTFFYDHDMGKKALEKIFEAYKEKTLSKSEIVGSYFIGIKIGNEFTGFIDSGSTYNIYYYLENNKIILTNTYYHLAKILDKTKVIEENVVAQCFQCAIIGNATIFENIYRLTGNQIIHFSDENWQIEHTRTSKTKKREKIWEEMYTIYEGGGYFDKTGIFMTGGQDSRLNLAIMLRLGFKPNLYYGVGNSANTFTKKEDEKIVEEIAQKCSLSLTKMDWSETDNTNIDLFLEKYGELGLLYRFNKNVIKQFEEVIDVDFICFGYFGEVYRNIESIENLKKNQYTVEEFVDELYIQRSLHNDYSFYQQYRSLIISQFTEICIDKGLSPERLDKDDFQKLHSAYRYRADTVMNNFANQFFYSFPFLGDGTMVELAEKLKFEEKINSRFLMKGIKFFAPELLDVPFFSHIKVKTLNLNTLELTDKEKTTYYKDIIRELIRNPLLIKFLRRIYYILRNDKKGYKEVQENYKEKQTYQEKLCNIYIKGFSAKELIKNYEARTLKEVLLYDYMIKKIKE
ncbi:hypothetical protein FMM74_015605 [Lachnospiraceae bacterium MD308]|nr:hypothetical protein [Lachnospiraceae bacterium MD308]